MTPPPKKEAKTDAREYEVLTGLNYPTANGEVRVEPGKVVSDLPAKSVSWLLAEGHIKPKED